MLRVIQSNRTELLVERLAEEVRQVRAEHGPFARVPVLVPNTHVASWLQLRLAERLGIAANLELLFLQRFVNHLIAEADPTLRLLDAAETRARLLTLFLTPEALQGGELEAVRRYLGRDEGTERRTLQLATHLSRLFEEYGFQRPAMVAGWEQGRSWPALAGAGAAALETERWQAALWRAVRSGAAARAEAEGKRVVTYVEVAHGPLFARAPLPERLFVFGVSHVARVFHDLLGRLAERIPVAWYSLSPCQEFWEDVPNRRGRHTPAPSPLPEGEEELFGLAPVENPLLMAWGRPGRESVRMLGALSGGDLEDAFPDSHPGTLLGLVQGQLQQRNWPKAEALPEIQREALAEEGSLTALACPSPRREAEAIAARIWSWVREEKIPFHRIAVIVGGSDPAERFAALTTAFRAAHDLPHHLVDGGALSSKPVGEAARLLLALPEGRFDRASLLALLAHPGLGLTDRLPPERVEGWVRELAVVAGLDAEDWADSYLADAPEGAVHDWSRGLSRLALGAFIGGDGGDAEERELGGLRLQPVALDGEGREAAGLLAEQVRRLAHFVRGVRRGPRPLVAWVELVAALFEGQLRARGEAAEGEVAGLLQAVRALGLDPLGGRPVPWRIAQGLIEEALDGLSRPHGQAHARGVVLSSGRPMRALPFDAIVFAGMEGDRFPASDQPDPIDLRRAVPAPGDLWPRDQDRYLFLEALLSARKRLLLTRVATEPSTGELRPESSVLSELKAHLARGFLGPAVAALEESVPLALPAELEQQPFAPLAQRKQLRAARLRRLLGEPDSEAEALAAANGELRPALEALLARGPAVVGRPARREGIQPLALGALGRFLACPLSAWSERVLGIDPPDGEAEEERLRSREALEPGSAETSRAARTALEASLRSGRPVEEEVQEVLGRAQRSGALPAGPFGEGLAQALPGLVGAWREGLEEALGRSVKPLRLQLGPAREGQPCDEAVPPLLVEVEVAGELRQVALGGGRLLFRGGDGEAVQVELSTGPHRMKGDGKPAQRNRISRLRDAWLWHLVGSARGAPLPEVLLLDPEGSAKRERVTFAPVEASVAKAQLAAWVGSFLGERHVVLLPIQWVAAHAIDDKSFEQLQQEALSADRGPSFATLWGPFGDRWSEFELPPEPRELVAQRLGAYLAALAHAGLESVEAERAAEAAAGADGKAKGAKAKKAAPTEDEPAPAKPEKAAKAASKGSTKGAKR